MEFQLEKSQKEIQKAVSEFARGEFDKELARDMDTAGEFPTRIWQNAADLGFVGIHFPEEFGGGGMGVLENALIAEEFCRKDSTIGAAVMLACFAAEYLLRFGSDQQKQTYLPAVLEGRMLSGAAFFGAENKPDSPGMAAVRQDRLCDQRRQGRFLLPALFQRERSKPSECGHGQGRGGRGGF